MDKTDKEYWEKQAEDLKMPCVINLKHPSRKKFDEYCQKLLKSNHNRSLIEIGCFPGRWLIYFKRAFQFDIYGIEYSRLLCEITQKNLEMCNVKGKIYCQDLFNHEIEKKFDIVFSAGFIEHFNDIEYPLQSCYNLLNRRGLLITMVPNMSNNIHEFFLKIFAPAAFSHHTRISRNDLRYAYKRLGLSEISVTPLGIWGTNLTSHSQRYKEVFIIYKKLDRYLQQLINRLHFIPETDLFSPYIIASGIKP